MEIHFLKTMWSDMILLKEGREAALIDTGTAEQAMDLSDYLEQQGVRELAFILVTHFHKDHYGGVPAIFSRFRVGEVYLKEYSGLDHITSWGAPADDAYRQQETETFEAIKRLSKEKSRLTPCEGLEAIGFAGHELRLFSAENSIRRIYEDETFPETYHRIAFSENQNSLAALMKVNGANIFFGGDLHDLPSSHPLADRVNLRIARQIGEEISLYKAPHHGTNGTGLKETLAIYRPQNTVITNGLKYLPPQSEIFVNIRAARPDARVYLTENQNVVFSVGQDGSVRLTEGPEPYDLTQGA